ncbi:MAG: ubiquinone biosynthesis protein [Gaiellaceae bacterium]|jgi:predicted unusual protein kinase regulating ubiquinone biosynthesis (AarF/ABC1/UbiB family)|nr:ubiquinone biosynthesis protein [Gaiellaceae bacterium]
MADKGKVKRALELTMVARRTHLLKVLREVGVVGDKPATREGAVRFREALEELGTTFVKLGQLLSSRPDLLPDVYIDELGKLVDDVPALPFAPLREVIEEDIGLEHFASIDEEPLASASIGQIHAALLKSGREVVVKVRRPGIVEQVALDLDLLRKTAALAEKHSDTAQLLQLNALTDDLEQHLNGELDFLEEAHNAGLIAAVIAEYQEDLFVPEVIQPYVTERVLVMERIHGVKVEDGHGLDPERARELARTFFRAYIRQITVKGLYHADPHRGNVFLTPDGRLALLDFGLIGRLDDDTRTSLALLLLAIAQNRADDVADLIISLSLTTTESDEAGFVHDLRRKLPRYQWRPLSGIKTGEGLADLQRLSLQHGIALPTSFALVGKTLSQAESIARTLDPELDPVQMIRGEGWTVMAQEAERRLEPNQLLAFGFTQLHPLLRLPRRLAQLTQKMESGTLKIGIAPVQLEDFERLLRSTANRIGAAMIISALLVASALMARVNHTLSVVGFLAAAGLGLYMLWRILRTPGGL